MAFPVALHPEGPRRDRLGPALRLIRLRPLSAAAEEYRGRGVRFFGLLYQDRPANARRWIREMGGQSYPTVLDPGSRVAIEFGVYGVPESDFIRRDGIVSHEHIGPVTDSLLSARIEALLSDSAAAGPGEPDVSKTPGWEKPGQRP